MIRPVIRAVISDAARITQHGQDNSFFRVAIGKPQRGQQVYYSVN